MRLRRADEGLRLVPRLERCSDDEGLIPLINVIFLILIFFMIAGHMETAGPFRVVPPLSRTDAPPLSGDLMLSLAADGRIAIGEELLSQDELESFLQRHGQSRAGAGGKAPPRITLKADAGVHSATLRSVLNHLRRAGIGEVMLLTDLGH